MNQQDVKYLGYIKNLVYQEKRRFEVRSDRDYLNDLLNLGITPLEAWNHILSLNKNLYFVDPKPNYFKDGKSLTFKKYINGKIAYIKIRVEKDDNDDEVVCLSFHEDGK